MTADIVILNGRLTTFDPSQPAATALAITGPLITAIGSDSSIRALAGPDTRVVDAMGATILPGFIDSHVHLFGGSVEQDTLNLYGIVGLAAMTAAIRPYATANPDDTVVFCAMADYDILGTGQGLTRHDLDTILTDRPLAMFAPDHHTIWANTAALDKAGILRGGATEPGSEIVMGDDGLATGELREPGAYAPVFALTRHGGRDMAGLITGKDPGPAAKPAERERDKDAIARGLAHCAAQGITGLHLMDGNRYQLELLSELEQEGRLLCRCHAPFHLKGTDPVDRLHTEATEMRDQHWGDMVRCSHVKMFIDGVTESGTALMLQPYPGALGADGNTGDEVFTQDHFVAACIAADALGFQIAVHAIGDAGVRRTIDAFEAAQAANGARDSRHRIEHLEVMHLDDIPRLPRLGIVASIQPGHAPRGHIFTAGDFETVLHPDQLPGAFAWQTIRDSGARVCFSTDWPVIPVDVMLTIKSAIAPRDLGPNWPDQTQTLTDTLASYTRDNAWVSFDEDRLGMLKPGFCADIVVLDRDVFALPPDQITDATARLTICDGRVTFDAGT